MLDYEGLQAKLTIVGVGTVQEQNVTATLDAESLNLTLER
jgi:hypothetical protein